MKEDSPDKDNSINEYIKAQKAAFREHQRNLSFSEKMQIAFALAECDKMIRRAVRLSKRIKEDK